MKLLIDSHVLYWLWTDDPRLRLNARSMLRITPAVVSLATYWELGIKIATGRMHLDEPLDDLIERDNFEVLEVKRAHAVEAWGLPAFHSDPFDRMLIAQAQTERAVVVTSDPIFARYGVPTLW